MDEWLAALNRQASQGKFAQRIGRSHAVFQKARLNRGKGGFNPTYQVMRDAEAHLIFDPEPTAKKIRKFGTNVHEKAYLPLVNGLELDDALMSAHRYIEYLRAEHHRVREIDLDLNLLESFEPQASGGNLSVHLVAYCPEHGKSVVERWGTVADYRGGRDLSGAKIEEVNDSSLTACLHEDYEDVAVNAWPQITILHRQHSWQDKSSRTKGRTFLRYMCRLEGIDGSPKVLCIRSLQEGAAADQLVENVFS